MRRILLVTLTALGLLVGLAHPAQASYPRYYYGHWANDDLYVDDNTSSWPVSTAAYRWSAYPNVVDVHYGRSCTVRCIHVDQVSSIPCSTCPAGVYVAGYSVVSWSNGVIVGCTIVLSNVTPTSGRLHVAVHEMGHCVGLGHPPAGTYSVMGSCCTSPTNIDLWNLRQNWKGVP